MGIGTLRRYHRFKAEAANEAKRRANSCTPLPDDFPGREALVAAGRECLEDLRGATLEELVAIKGIGKKTAARILAALEA